MEYFRKQNEFLAAMMVTFERGEIDGTFAPYFRWKKGGDTPTRNEAYSMMNKASSELERLFECEEDTHLPQYLEAIDSELTSMLPLLR